MTDFHTHILTENFRKALKDMGIDPLKTDKFPLPNWDENEHLKFMKEAGIEYSVLSVPSPHINYGDNEKSRKYAKLINEEVSAIVNKNREKFGFVAVLPLPDVEASIEEINYSFDKLGALGVKITSHSNGVYLGDKSLDSVMEELDKRNALVIIHPDRAKDIPENTMTSDFAAAIYEYPVDTTRALINMIANNIMVRFPNIKFVIPHVGSFLPYMKSRFTGIANILASRGMIEPIDVEANIKNLYFDIAGDPEPVALDMLLMITDEEHIVYGSDYPYVVAEVCKRKKESFENNPKYKDILNKIFVENGKSYWKKVSENK